MLFAVQVKWLSDLRPCSHPFKKQGQRLAVLLHWAVCWLAAKYTDKVISLETHLAYMAFYSAINTLCSVLPVLQLPHVQVPALVLV